jgi:molecular chaperone DnaK (HSP70)
MGKIIGIDLGTKTFCVSVMEGNEAVVIPNRRKELHHLSSLLEKLK